MMNINFKMILLSWLKITVHPNDHGDTSTAAALTPRHKAIVGTIHALQD